MEKCRTSWRTSAFCRNRCDDGLVDRVELNIGRRESSDCRTGEDLLMRLTPKEVR